MSETQNPRLRERHKQREQVVLIHLAMTPALVNMMRDQAGPECKKPADYLHKLLTEVIIPEQTEEVFKRHLLRQTPDLARR